jgi:hypothetical protein
MTEPVVHDSTRATMRAGKRVHPAPVFGRADILLISKVKSGTSAMGRPLITAPGGDPRALTQVFAGRIILNRRHPVQGH